MPIGSFMNALPPAVYLLEHLQQDVERSLF